MPANAGINGENGLVCAIPFADDGKRVASTGIRSAGDAAHGNIRGWIYIGPARAGPRTHGFWTFQPTSAGGRVGCKESCVNRRYHAQVVSGVGQTGHRRRAIGPHPETLVCDIVREIRVYVGIRRWTPEGIWISCLVGVAARKVIGGEPTHWGLVEFQPIAHDATGGRPGRYVAVDERQDAGAAGVGRGIYLPAIVVLLVPTGVVSEYKPVVRRAHWGSTAWPVDAVGHKVVVPDYGDSSGGYIDGIQSSLILIALIKSPGALCDRESQKNRLSCQATACFKVHRARPPESEAHPRIRKESTPK